MSLEHVFSDALEKAAAEYLACEEPEAAKAIETWALLSANGRSKVFDEAFCDHMERLLSRAIYRFQQLAEEEEGLADKDQHETHLGVGA